MTTPEDQVVRESDEEALYRAAHAQISTETDARAEEGSTPTDAATGDPARRDRYAEAIESGLVPMLRHIFGSDPAAPREFIDAVEELIQRDTVAPVLAVADGELAGLRAEVERLRNDNSELTRRWMQATNRWHDADAELRALREGIKALADDWEEPLAGARQRYNGSDEFQAIIEEETHRKQHAAELRALLAPSPAATTGEAGALRRISTLLALREANDVRDEDGFVVVRADDVRAMFPPHACEGDGTCVHCGADEPPPWPTPPAPVSSGEACPVCGGRGTVTQAIDRHGRRYINQPVEDREQVCDNCDGTGQIAPERKWCRFHDFHEDDAECTCPAVPFPVSSASAPAATTGETEAGDRVRAFVVARDAFYGPGAGDEDLLGVLAGADGERPTLLWSDLRALVGAPSPVTSSGEACYRCAGPATPGYETHDSEPVCTRCVTELEEVNRVRRAQERTQAPIAEGVALYVDSPCPSCGRTDEPGDRFHVCPPTNPESEKP